MSDPHGRTPETIRVRIYSGTGTPDPSDPATASLPLSIGMFQLIEVDVPKPEVVLWLVQPEAKKFANTRELPPGTKVFGRLQGEAEAQLHSPTSSTSGLYYLEGKAAGKFQLTAIINGSAGSKPVVIFSREVIVSGGGVIIPNVPDTNSTLVSKLRQALADDLDPFTKKKEHAATLGQVYAEAADRFTGAGGAFRVVVGWLQEQSSARGVIFQYDQDGTPIQYLPKLRAAIRAHTQLPETGVEWTVDLRDQMLPRFRDVGNALKEITK